MTGAGGISSFMHFTRQLSWVWLVCTALSLAGCLTSPASDSGGGYYALLRGSVSYANGTAVARAPVGVSCLGSAGEPFGITSDADANGRFEMEVTVSMAFEPLDGGRFMCTVQTPYLTAAAVTRQVSVAVSTTPSNRPVTDVNLVVP